MKTTLKRIPRLFFALVGLLAWTSGPVLHAEDKAEPADAELEWGKDKGAKLEKLAKELYQKMGLKAGAANEGFKAYAENMPASEVTFDMVPVKGGVFTMGSPADDPNRSPNELLAHQVQVSDFWMGKREVTWDEYDLWTGAFNKVGRLRDQIEAGRIPKRKEGTVADAFLYALCDAVTAPSDPYMDMTFGMGRNGFPAIAMTRLSAKTYCMWLSARTGKFYRLPTEAEWEYACKAGTNTAYSFGDDKESLSKHAWHFRNSRFKYQKVGTKPANPFGLHDMHGNVWEWVLDRYHPPAEKAPDKLLVNPVMVPVAKHFRTVKGGSWDDDDSKMLRSAARMASNKLWKQSDPRFPQSVWYLTDGLFIGFRIVRPRKVPPPEDLKKYWVTKEDLEPFHAR